MLSLYLVIALQASISVASGSDQAPFARPLRILCLGDSLTAGYGLAQMEAFPPRLQEALQGKGVPAEVINAGVSGDTTAGGLARLNWALASSPDLVILELGANDGLRGLSPEAMKLNLDSILKVLKDRKIEVLLTGMRAPRNLGEDYVRRFDRVYEDLAEKHQVPLYPFFLEGVAGLRDLNQPDGLHPNAAGIEEVVRRILPYVLDIINEITPTSGAGGSCSAGT